MFRFFSRSTILQTDFGLLVVRLVFGLGIALGHGLDKVSNFERFNTSVDKLGIPLPEVMGTLAALGEFMGGFLLVMGFFTRGAAAAILATMGVAVVFVHGTDPLFCMPAPCKEFALLYLAAALGILIAGPGRISVDYLLFGRQPRPKSPPPEGASPASGAAGTGAGPRAGSGTDRAGSGAGAEDGSRTGDPGSGPAGAAGADPGAEGHREPGRS